jgi:DNA-binding response OmpR family regulator
MALTPQEQALVDTLSRRPRAVFSREALLRHLPAQDHVTASNRSPRQVGVVVTMVRHKLGKSAIETVWGEGYRLGPGTRRIVGA